MSRRNDCFDCKERRIGCHSECEKYIKYRNEQDEINKKRKLDDEIFSYKSEKKRIAIRKENRKGKFRSNNFR